MLPILNDTYGPQIPESTMNRIFDSIVKIEVDYSSATGFFLQIKIRDRELNCLVTNDHVIPQEYVNSKKIIFLYYGKKEKEIIKIIKLDENERFIRCFPEPKDITIIEIKNYDNIPYYKFLQPDLGYKNGYNQYLYKKYYLAGYPRVDDYLHKNERHISSGLITKIGNNYFEFEHSLDRRVGSSGSPICLLSNEKVVGIHKAHRFEDYYGEYSINIATFIGIIIDELDDEYFLLPKINNLEDITYGYNHPKKKVLTHSKTQNFIDFNSIFPESLFESQTTNIINSIFTPKINTFVKLLNDLDKEISNIMDESFSNFETKSFMNIGLFDFDIDFDLGFKTKKSTKEEKKVENLRSKTPVNFDCSLFSNYSSCTQNKINYNNNHYNYNEYTSTKSSIRIMNKSCEPKLKRKKKKKNKNKKKQANNISNIISTNKNMYNIHTSNIKLKNNQITGYSNISNYNIKSNYFEINHKNEKFMAEIGKSRNYHCYTSKSYDNIKANINTSHRKVNFEIKTIQSNYGYYENNFTGNYNNYYL